jgi:hypothetical protein
MNQVTEKKEGALAANLFEADANQGTQNISQEDLALPFLKILGQLSPEVNKRDGKYVEGAEPGKIINTVTNALYDTINVIPVFYRRQYIEWQDRGTSTGAPVAIHDANSDIVIVKLLEVKTTKIDYQMVTILITLQVILY